MKKQSFLVYRYILIVLLIHSIGFADDRNIDSNIVTKSKYIILHKNESQNFKILKQKGEYTISSPFDGDDAVRWAKKFNIVELGDIHNDKLTYDLLKKEGIFSIKHHIAYDWMPAFYYNLNGDNGRFVSWLYKNRKVATLNPNGPFIHCRDNHYDWCKDYYYNLGDTQVFDRRIDDLINSIQSKGFNGVFFDWASGGYILQKKYSTVLSNFETRNPGKNYFKLIGSFYKKLKEKKIFVVTNQAFRKHRYLLPFISYDMTESYITTVRYIKQKMQIQGVGWVDSVAVTDYYPIDANSNTLQDSLRYLDLLTRYKKEYKKNGFKNFIYLNYLAPVYKKVYQSSLLYREEKPKNGIYFSYAMAKLTNNLVYAEVPENRKLEQDDIYFYKLGEPLGTGYEKLKSIGGYIRFYQNGFVLVSEAHQHDIYLDISSRFLPEKAEVYDAYDRSWVQAKQKRVTVKLHFVKSNLQQSFLPLGRVYLYAR